MFCYLPRGGEYQTGGWHNDMLCKLLGISPESIITEILKWLLDLYLFVGRIFAGGLELWEPPS